MTFDRNESNMKYPTMPESMKDPSKTLFNLREVASILITLTLAKSNSHPKGEKPMQKRPQIITPMLPLLAPLVVLAFALINPCAATASGWTHTWGGASDDYGYAVTHDGSGNVYVVGYTTSFGAGSADALILKYSPTGTLLWAKTWGGSNDDYAVSIAFGPDGYLYVVGATYSFGTVWFNMFLLKLDTDGDLQWGTTWGGTSFDYADDLGFDSQGNIYVVGESYSFGNCTVLLKFSPNGGSPLWTATWKGPATYDSGYSLAVDLDGNVVISGASWDYSVSPGHSSILLLKYDGNGTLLWSENWTTPTPGDDQMGNFRMLTTDSQRNVYVAGRHAAQCTNQDSSQCNFDALLLKVDSSGSFQWAKTWGGAGWDGAGSLAFDPSGKLVVSSIENAFVPASTLFLLTFDTAGNVLSSSKWDSQAFGTGMDHPHMILDGAGNVYVAGAAQNNTGTWAPTLLPSLATLPNSLVSNPYSVGAPVGGQISLTTPLQLQTGGVIDTGGGGADAFVALTSEPTNEPAATLSTSTLTFGSEPVNGTSASESATLTNSGNASLTISGIVPSGDFALGSTGTSCPYTGGAVSSGATCTIDVTFTPTTTGTRNGAVTITDNDKGVAGSTQTLNLTGTGVPSTTGAPAVQLSPNVMDFPAQTVSTTSAAHSVTVTNTGTADLTISTVTKGGTNPGDFALSADTCTGATVAPNKSCTISVAFAPTATGSRKGNLVFTDDAGDSPQSVSLTGTGTPMPVILIPGIMGSELVKEGVIGQDLWTDTLSPGAYGQLSLFGDDSPSLGITATDVIRGVNVNINGIGDLRVYGPIIDFLTCQNDSNGTCPKDSSGRPLYPLYQLSSDVNLLPGAGCDISQSSINPKLFLFPYDWRFRNAISASKLANYIGCIRQFYPGTKVNLVAHSMGGLVARRYILDNSDHHVNVLVTIATPWLGTPYMIECLAAGDCTNWLVNLVDSSTFKYIAGSMTGAQELLPSKTYFDLGGAPLAEEGWDWNNDGNPNGSPNQTYNYSQYIAALNQHFGFDHGGTQGFYPGTVTETFHDYSTSLGSEDNWPNDKSGVQYYQIYGAQKMANTISQVVAFQVPGCAALTNAGSTTCTATELELLKIKDGDGTVPVLSATRGLNYSTNESLIPFQSADQSTDGTVSHLGLLQNQGVQDEVLTLLSLPLQTSSTIATTSVQQKEAVPTSISFQSANYLTIVGGDIVVVSDTQGNSTAAITGILHGTVPNVSTYGLGKGAMMVILPTDAEYTVTFQTTTTPLNIVLNIGTPDSTTQAIRYVDINQPAGLNCKLHFLPASIGPLLVDTNKDGSFATTVSPTVNLSGSAANDTTPPVVLFSATVQGPATTVTIAATDSGSGVKDLFFSLDGTTFKSYTAPLQLDASKNPVVYAFADDKAANRSSLVTFSLPRPAVTLQSSLTFPATPAGSTTSAQSLTVSNPGKAPLVISGVSVTGDFSQSNNCPSSPSAIPISGSCTINVTFKPTAGGTRTGSITISDNAPGSPHHVALSGTGQDFTVAAASGSSTSATVAPGSPATYTLSAAGEGGFNQSVSFTCTGAPSEATCSVSPNPVTAGSSATHVTVTVTTTAPSVSAPRSRPLPPLPPLSPGLRGLVMLAFVLAAMAWAVVRRNQAGVTRWQSTMLPLATVLLLTLAMAACGGGGAGGGGGGPTPNPGTPAGTYTLTVTGTAGSGSSALSHSVTLTLTVS